MMCRRSSAMMLVPAAGVAAFSAMVLAGCGGIPGFGARSMPKVCNKTKASEHKPRSDGELRRPEDEVEVYFGCGCFWHVQHEFVELEMSELCRTGEELTAFASYGGGTKVGEGGLVCYHNMEGKAYYGSMGHAEVVTLTIKESDFHLAADRFWKVCPGGNRRDTGDRGLEYRAAIGLPGGMASPLMPALRQAAGSVELVSGDGSEGDNLHTGQVSVYDTASFPAHVAEKYHQFHDDMVESYGSEYHELRRFAEATGCPGDSSLNPIR